MSGAANPNESRTFAELRLLVDQRTDRADPLEMPDSSFVGMDSIEPNSTRPSKMYRFKNFRSVGSCYDAGDVLYGRLRPYLNKVWAADSAGVCSGEFIVLRPSACLTSKFLQYLLHSRRFVDVASRQVSGDRPRIKFEQVGSFGFFVPPVPEQRAIVAKIERLFSELESGIENLKTAKAKLSIYRQAVLTKAFEGELTKEWRERQENLPDAEELLAGIQKERERAAREQGRKLKPVKPLTEAEIAALPKLPEGWRWATIETAGAVQLGRQRAPQFHSGEHMRPYLRVANVFEGRLALTDVKQMNFSPDEVPMYELRNGDLLLNEGQSLELVGRPAMFRNEIQGACFQNTLVRFRPYDGICSDYALRVFLMQYRYGKYRSIAKITTSMAHLGAQRFAAVEFPVCSTEEQLQIVSEIESRLSVCDALEATIARGLERAEALRQSILKKAFEGRLLTETELEETRREPDWEPAEKLLERIMRERASESAAGGQHGEKRGAGRRNKAGSGEESIKRAARGHGTKKKAPVR